MQELRDTLPVAGPWRAPTGAEERDQRRRARPVPERDAEGEEGESGARKLGTVPVRASQNGRRNSAITLMMAPPCRPSMAARFRSGSSGRKATAPDWRTPSGRGRWPSVPRTFRPPAWRGDARRGPVEGRHGGGKQDTVRERPAQLVPELPVAADQDEAGGLRRHEAPGGPGRAGADHRRIDRREHFHPALGVARSRSPEKLALTSASRSLYVGGIGNGQGRAQTLERAVGVGCARRPPLAAAELGNADAGGPLARCVARPKRATYSHVATRAP